MFDGIDWRRHRDTFIGVLAFFVAVCTIVGAATLFDAIAEVLR